MFYIMDTANGNYITMGRTVIPVVAYVGPFDTEAKAAAYLADSVGFTYGGNCPEGYAIIRFYEPRTLSPDTPKPEITRGHFAKPWYLDMKIRYKQVARKTLARRKKRAKK